MNPVFRLACGAGLAAAALGAHAVPFTYSTDFSGGVGAEWAIATSFNNNDAGILGQLQDGSATLNLVSPGVGSGVLAFDLLGFRTVDGVNCCTDTFQLSVNGTLAMWGNFAMGGGGGEQSFFVNGFTGTVAGSGMSRQITLDTSIAPGANAWKFDYGAMQGFGDEAWGLDNVRIDGDVTPVPEPATYALLLGGLALVAVARRRAG